MIRILFLGAAVIFGIYMVFRFVGMFTPKSNACPDCDGKGYWYGLREREKCKRCGGTGELEK